MADIPPPIVGEILGRHQVLALATTDGNNPWVSQVFFAEELSSNGISIFSPRSNLRESGAS